MPAAINLLGRALDLGGDTLRDRPMLLRELSEALWAWGDLTAAETTLAAALDAAIATGDRRLEWYVRLDGSARRALTARAVAADVERVAKEAVSVFEELGDDLGQARAWRGIARVGRVECSFSKAREAAERALAHAKTAGDSNEIAGIVDVLCTTLLYGPAPADEASDRCAEIASAADGDLLLEANVASSRAGLAAMLGDFDEAAMLVARAAAVYDGLGHRMFRAGLAEVAAPIELLAGHPDAAERELRLAFEILAESGDTALLAYPALMLAETLLAQARQEEARHFAEIGKAAASPDDRMDQILARMVEAALRVREADFVCAETEARRAVAAAERTDALALHGDALARLGEVLAAAGRPEDAHAAFEQAVELYERKRHVVAARTATSAARALGFSSQPR